MQAERLKILLDFYQQEPQDPFNCYALAMEYLKTAPRTALGYLETLLETHPDYLPTYYQAAQLLEQTNSQRAELVYKKGLKLAEAQKNSKIFQELQRALRNFQDDLADD